MLWGNLWFDDWAFIFWLSRVMKWHISGHLYNFGNVLNLLLRYIHGPVRLELCFWHRLLVGIELGKAFVSSIRDHAVRWARFIWIFRPCVVMYMITLGVYIYTMQSNGKLASSKIVTQNIFTISLPLKIQVRIKSCLIQKYHWLEWLWEYLVGQVPCWL